MAADRWSVRCTDIADRERVLAVHVTGDRVLLIMPPGESAVLTSERVGQLRGVLAVALLGAHVDVPRRPRDLGANR